LVSLNQTEFSQQLTPSKIVEELDKYIIGQKDAKKAVAIALRNRWRRLSAAEEIRKEIIPNNILMIGSTGVGKTEIARRLAQLADAPFIKVEASKFTEVGYVGRDVESMVRDLVEQSVNLVKSLYMARVKQKAYENVLEHILDELLPPLNSKVGSSEAVSEEDMQWSQKTRDKLREMLEKGELDERKIDIEVSVSAQNVHVMGPMGIEGLDGLQDMLSNMMPKKRKTRSVTIAEAKEYLLEEESQKMIDMDAVTREALEKAQQSGIIFIDEIDKIASRAGRIGGGDVSREGVQRDLLPVVEGTTVNTKYGSVKTDHMLFIAAGAFHVAKPSDLIPELQGRFPIRVELAPLTKDDFVKILKQPRNALTRQYQALLASEQVELTFDDEAIEEIASFAYELNVEVENIGARRLHTIMSNILETILFEVPDLSEERQFHITQEFVINKLQPIVRSKDLSHFVL
jgi:ATP-dependent HslUV protease ATP-binding subunit HslU